LKLYAYGKDFYKSAWNIFDASVVIVSILPAAGSFAVFRALRILRTLRLLNNVPKLKLIIESLLLAVPSIGWIMVLLIIIFYVFAVIGTALFGVDFPEYFGTLGRSFYTLFQIMTLESWSSAIARPIQETSPLSALYFVTFILIATYTTLNIFIAIVVNTMNELHHRDLQAEEEHIKSFIESENKKVLKKFETMQDQLKEDLKNEIRNIYEKDTTPK
jgi:voltage-gated sodium channel